MNAKVFVVGLILVFLAFAVNQIAIPIPGVIDWEPWPGVHIPIPGINYVNPLGWLVYPLALVGAIFIIFGLTANAPLRIILAIIAFAATLFLTAYPLSGLI